MPEQSNAQRSWSTRHSLRIAVGMPDSATGAPQLWGLGEATPLPGFSPETLADCEQWLRTLDLSQFVVQASEKPVSLLDRLTPLLETAPAAARFGVESAVLALWAKSRGQTLCYALLDGKSPVRPDQIPLPCALLNVWCDDFIASAQRLTEQGVRRLKIKIGRNLPLEIQRLSTLAAAFPISFRLDANQALETSAIEQTIERLAHLPVEYVEEPAPLTALGRPRAMALPLAFDESLLDTANGEVLLDWINSGHTRALVYKPMLLGGVRRALDWRSIADRAGALFVLSHLFDGSIAMEVYRALAAWLEPSVSHGLADHSALKLWSATETKA